MNNLVDTSPALAAGTQTRLTLVFELRAWAMSTTVDSWLWLTFCNGLRWFVTARLLL